MKNYIEIFYPGSWTRSQIEQFEKERGLKDIVKQQGVSRRSLKLNYPRGVDKEVVWSYKYFIP